MVAPPPAHPSDVELFFDLLPRPVADVHQASAQVDRGRSHGNDDGAGGAAVADGEPDQDHDVVEIHATDARRHLQLVVDGGPDMLSGGRLQDAT